MLTLFGSFTSPFVRRIRLLLANQEHEFRPVNIFDPEDKAMIKKVNPTIKIPMISDGDNYVYDSRVIYRYLQEKLALPKITWEQENQLTIIDSANDSFVQLFLLKRSEFDIGEDRLYFNMQKDRLDQVISVLDEQAKAGAYNDWHYPSICLYCLMDWLMFRELYDFSAYENLMAFHKQFQTREDVVATEHVG